MNGLGLFTEEDIRKGDLIYTPNSLLDINLSQEEFDSLTESEQEHITYHGYFHEKSKKWHVAHGGIQFINHADSSVANVTQDEDMNLFAKRDIKSGEELLQNYAELFPVTNEHFSRINRIIHHHLIYQAKVGDLPSSADSEEYFNSFLLDLIKEIDMEVLIPPRSILSEHDAWTGLVGIVTSHISFHYWKKEKYVQLDIYSCKKFHIDKTISFLNNFWKATDAKILFVNRKEGEDFTCQKIN